MNPEITEVVVQPLTEMLVEVLPGGFIEVEQAIIGQPGPPGAPGTSQQTVFTDTVPANTTKVIDTVSISDFFNVEYLFVAKNIAQAKMKGLKMLANTLGFNQVYNKNGTALQMAIDTIIDGPDLKLQIQNSESFDLNVSFIRNKL